MLTLYHPVSTCVHGILDYRLWMPPDTVISTMVETAGATTKSCEICIYWFYIAYNVHIICMTCLTRNSNHQIISNQLQIYLQPWSESKPSQEAMMSKWWVKSKVPKVPVPIPQSFHQVHSAPCPWDFPTPQFERRSQWSCHWNQYLSWSETNQWRMCCGDKLWNILQTTSPAQSRALTVKIQRQRFEN